MKNHLLVFMVESSTNVPLVHSDRKLNHQRAKSQNHHPSAHPAKTIKNAAEILRRHLATTCDQIRKIWAPSVSTTTASTNTTTTY